VLARLAGELCDGLQRKQARGRTIAIKVRLDDWTTVTRARTLPGAVNDTETVTGVAVELLRAYAPPRPVRLLGVRVAAFDERSGEPTAGGEASGRDGKAAGRGRNEEEAAAPVMSPQLALEL
jgi:DNA polymerase-4